MRVERIRRVLENLERMGLEQMVVTDAVSILYLTDIWVDAGERLVALYLNKSGKHCLFVNHMFTLPQDPGIEVVRFSDTDPYIGMLGARVDSGKVLGVDKNMPSRFLLPLMDQGSGAGFVNGSLAVDEARGIKDQAEQEAMGRVSAINDQAMARFRGLLKEGVTERQVAGQMKEIYQSLGADDLSFPPSVCFGANGAVSSANQACAQAGQIFSIEPGIYLEGEMGVRIEDLVLVTEDGCRILNSYSKELEIL